jgi:gliding motility-associated-like protein
VRYFFLIIFVLCLPLISSAQFSAPESSAVRFTSYPSSPTVKDPIFIFCNSSGSQKATLIAKSPHGTLPFNYTWYQWSDVTKSFSTLLKTESGVLTSTTSNLNEGGYKVFISGGFDTTLVCWIAINKPFSSAALQNATCDYVALKGQAVADTFYYRNIANGIKVRLSDAVKFLWSSEPQSSIPFPDFSLSPQTFDPPLADVTYKLRVTDSFGCVSESSFPFTSIRVKADFTADPVTGQAPLSVNITDNSTRATNYLWEFGDPNDTTTSKKSNPDPHVYYKPGEYSIKLTVQNDETRCIDSMKLEQKIVVDISELNIPNVFTPNGDGLNDNFVVQSKSLMNLSMEVFSRSGMRVYYFYGQSDLIPAWTGWDGNINSSSVKAAPGIYFYIIKAKGWDDVDYVGKEYRGYVYLYR